MTSGSGSGLAAGTLGGRHTLGQSVANIAPTANVAVLAAAVAAIAGNGAWLSWLVATIAVLVFAGFESAAAFGVEARDPRRAVPTAILASAAIVGIFFVFNAYGQQAGLGSAAAVADSPAPLNQLAATLGVTWVGGALDASICLSLFACYTAAANTIGRVLFTAAAHRQAPGLLRRTSAGGSPVAAISVVTIEAAGVIGLLGVARVPAATAIRDLSQVSGLCAGLAYLLVSLAIPVLLRHAGQLRPAHAVAGVVASGVIAAVLAGSVLPGRWFAPGFIVVSLASLALVWIFARRPAPALAELAATGGSQEPAVPGS